MNNFNIVNSAWETLWPLERKRQRAFFLFGLALIVQMDIEGTRTFFRTFFRLPTWYTLTLNPFSIFFHLSFAYFISMHWPSFAANMTCPIGTSLLLQITFTFFHITFTFFHLALDSLILHILVSEVISNFSLYVCAVCSNNKCTAVHVTSTFIVS